MERTQAEGEQAVHRHGGHLEADGTSGHPSGRCPASRRRQR
jgi:hypothetical protein